MASPRAAAQPPRFDPLPELYVDALERDPRVRRVRDGDEFLPGVVLQLIANDHVLFTRNGVEGRLDFPSAAATQPAGGAK